jgi:hypothetical protein
MDEENGVPRRFQRVFRLHPDFDLVELAERDSVRQFGLGPNTPHGEKVEAAKHHDRRDREPDHRRPEELAAALEQIEIG